MLAIEGPRTRVVYPTKKCVELPEMHKNGLKIHTPQRKIARKFGKIEYSECSETHFAKTPSQVRGVQTNVSRLAHSGSQPFNLAK